MEHVAHYEGGNTVHRPLHADHEARAVIERAKKGYYRVVDGISSHADAGIDLRGKTPHPTHSYVLRGVAHHLDARGFAILQRFLSKRRLTVLAKNLIESGEYDKLASEYGFEKGAFGKTAKSDDSDLAAALASMA